LRGDRIGSKSVSGGMFGSASRLFLVRDECFHWNLRSEYDSSNGK